MKIAIVTDSTADVPEDLAEELGIHIVPNYIILHGQSMEDGKGISRQDFYEQLPESTPLPTTSTAPIGAYSNLYERLFKQGYDSIISIHAAEKLSGIINAARGAASAFGERIKVIDSQQVSLGLGFQVLAAAESASLGLPIHAIQAHLDDLRKRVRLVAMLDTLEYVRRSGRVSWARASLGSLLRIKPFVELRNGIVYSLGEARTRRKGLERLYKMLSDLGPLERLAVLHSNAEAEARQFLEEVLQRLNIRLAFPPLVVNVTTIIGTHVGPNGIGFTVVLEDSRP